MIEEIKKRLDAGEVVELECVDIEGLLSDNKSASEAWINAVRKGVIKVSEVERLSGRVRFIATEDIVCFLLFEDLKYFRIKRPVPTFNDLIDVAVKACKEDKIYFRFLSSDQISFSADNTEEGKINILKQSCGQEELQEAIDFINSLYTETFVIESVEDLKGLFTVDENMTITTVSGSVFRFGDFGNLIMLGTSTLFKLIKGATVIRKRG